MKIRILDLAAGLSTKVNDTVDPTYNKVKMMNRTALMFPMILCYLLFPWPLFALEIPLEEIRKIAEGGHPVAQYKMGKSYFNGNGVAKNDDEALIWYQKAANQGYIFAQYNLGVIYQTGNGATKDYAKALNWYTKAAENGYAGALNKLGLMHENGQGVIQNFSEARKWYTMAAERGYAGAQYNLALVYYNGRGVPRDNIKAYLWCSIAAEGGHLAGKNYLTLISSKMKPDEIQKAQLQAAKIRELTVKNLSNLQ